MLRKNDYIKNTGRELNALGDKFSDYIAMTQQDLKQMDILMENSGDIDKIKEQTGKIKENFLFLSHSDDYPANPGIFS
ncbi:MAG: hypothetical protein KAI40_11045 [Desulfobacterales bacterium]|nr:hypothetical protein [Desulfobacterales bacterium]